MRHITNWFKYKPRKLQDLGNQKSCTIPGQDQSIKKILEQHSRGMPLPQSTEGQYFGELDVPDFEGMDLVDVMEYATSLKNQINHLQADLNRQNTAVQTLINDNQTETTTKPPQPPEKQATTEKSTISP